MVRVQLFCLVIVAAFAGCSELPVAPDAAWAERALPSGDGHDHGDYAHHANRTTDNFQITGFDPLISDYYGRAAGSYFCGDVGTDPDRKIAAVESRSDVGFALADVTDPANPTWLGELVMAGTHIYDLAVTPDSQFVVLATSTVKPEGLTLTWQRPCQAAATEVPFASPEDPVPRPGSVILVDIADPANPVIVDQQPLPGWGHSAHSVTIDGRTWVLIASTGVGGPVDGTQGISAYSAPSAFEFYEITTAAGNARLNLLSIYKPPGNDGISGPPAHDGWIAQHPGTGKTLAYLAGGDRLSILDLADPTAPQLVGSWSDSGPNRGGFSANLHSVLPMADLWDGRHYTILGPEFAGHPTDHPTGILWVLDTTDPAAPTAAGAWTLPSEVEWNGTYMFSNHYFTIQGRTAFISMYHGGVWAIDLASIASAPFVNLPSSGVFLPVPDEPSKAAVQQRWSPTMEEVLPIGDHLLTFDGNVGLYTFQYDAARPAPAPDPWPLSPP